MTTKKPEQPAHQAVIAELTRPQVEERFKDTRKPAVIERGNLTYNDYLKVPELLQLQTPQSDPPHHDEMLFIVIHQAYELWFKLIIHEVVQAIRCMDANQPLEAQHFMNRVVEILRVLVGQIHLVETMRPIDFLQFRHRLMPASGFQSVQFRQLEFMAGIKDPRYCTFFDERPEMRADLEQALEGDDLRAAFTRLLRTRELDIPDEALDADKRDDPEVLARTVAGIRPVYQDPQHDRAAYLLMEALVSFDEYLSLWRHHHVRVVARVIGWRPGTGGSSGVDYLRSTASKSAFPELWAVRTQLRRDGEPEPNDDDATPGPGCPMHG